MSGSISPSTPSGSARGWFRWWYLSPLAVVVFLLVLLFAGVFYLTATRSGTATLIGFASRTLPALEITGVDGALLNQLAIDTIVWEKDGLEIAVTQSTLKASLFPPRLRIENLSAKRITVTLPETEKPQQREPFTINLPDIHLPLDVDLDSIVVDELHLRQGEALVKLRDVRLSALFKDDTLNVRQLAGDLYDEQGDIAVKVRGVLGLSTPHPVQLTVGVTGDSQRLGSGELSLSVSGKMVNYRLQADGYWKYARYPRYQLLLEGQGNLEQLQVETLSLKGKGGNAQLRGRMVWSPELNWDMVLAGDQLNPAFLLQDYTGKLDMRWVTTGSLTDTAHINLELKSLQGYVQGYPVDAAMQLVLDDKTMTLKQLHAQVGDNRLSARGEVARMDVDKPTLALHWQLDAPQMAQLTSSIEGKLNGQGTLSALADGSELVLEIEKLSGKVMDFPIQLEGKILQKDQQVSAQRITLQVANNQVTLNGILNRKDATHQGMHWRLDANDLSQLYPDISGSLDAQGQLFAKLDGSAFQASIGTLTGELLGRPVNAQGKIVSTSGQLLVQKLRVTAGSNQLDISGQASEPFDLAWRIQAPKLAQLWPGLAGTLHGKGYLKGNLKQPQVQAELDGKQLRYEDLRLGLLDARLEQKDTHYSLTTLMKDIRQGDMQIRDMVLNGKGTLENHQLELDLAAKDGKLNLAARGGWRDEQWQGKVQTLRLRQTPAGDWRLNNPIALKASAEQSTVSHFCLTNQKRARLCTQVQWSPEQGLVSSGRLEQIPLAMASPWLPETISLAGLLNADFDVVVRDGQPKGKLDVRLPDSSFSFRKALRGGRTTRGETFYYSGAAVNVILEPAAVKLQAGMDLKNRGQLQAKGRIDLAQNPQQSRLDIKTTLAIPDIHWLQQFSNNVDALKGSLAGDIIIKGSLAKPQVTGAVQLKEASLLLPETGASLDAINLTLQAKRSDQLAINGTLKAGPGNLNAQGVLYLADLPRWKADLTLKGERLLLMNTHEVQAYVSPNVMLKAKPDAVVITGTVKIPETTISLREIPVTAKKRSGDIVIVGREQATQPHRRSHASSAEALLIQPNVVVELGEKVNFTGLGFKSRFSGRLRVLQNRQDIMTQGTLNIVDGVYQAYGQQLEIERGRLIFNGAVDNPALDIRAIRRIPGDILVGIMLKGTAQQPESELFSNPLQTETDTLSYLLTGRSASSATAADSAMLTNAVAGLGIRGGETMAQKLGGQLGLDDVGISSRTGNYKDSELSLGKRIGSRLYVKYIVGLFDSLQKVAVTYQINERIQTEVLTGEQQEIKLKYKFDTDKGFFGK